MATIRDFMTREVHSCRIDDTLDAAAGKMWDFDIGCLPIVDDDDHPIGIVTDRDVCMAAYTQGRPLREIVVGSAMAKELFTCAPDDPVSRAEALMQRHQIRRLPVVEEGRLAGILSMNDLARAAQVRESGGRASVSAEDVEATLAAICEPRTQGELVLSGPSA